MKSKQKRSQTRLSPNQAAALSSLAEGLTVEEIAADWGVTQTVVYKNIDRARKKLEARTTPHAVALWIRRQAVPVASADLDTEAISRNGASNWERE